jgi:hypothetical protein
MLADKLTIGKTIYHVIVTEDSFPSPTYESVVHKEFVGEERVVNQDFYNEKFWN